MIQYPKNILTVLAILAIIGFMVFLFGCATLSTVKTTVTDPEDKVWVVESKNDALVEITKKDGTTLKVDNRGKTGFFQMYMEYLLINAAPTVELGNQPGDND